MIEQAKISMLNVMSSIYFCSYYLDLDNGTFITVKGTPHIDAIMKGKNLSQQAVNCFINDVVKEATRQDLMEFVDLSTLKQRLKGQSHVSIEYESKFSGWCKAFFFPVKDANGNVTHAVFAVQTINDQKVKELNQMKELKQQTALVELLSEKYYLLCIVDLEKNTYSFLSSSNKLKSMLDEANNSNLGFANVIDTFVVDEYKPLVRQFVDVKTICQRMARANHLSMEYKDKYVGMCKFDVSILSRNNAGYPTSITFTSRIIEVELPKEAAFPKIKDKKILELINTDHLTGLLNRRAYDSITEKLKVKQTIGLIIVDVDDFKRINDENGHDIGDKVLIKCAELLKAICRTTDYVFRFGGDEFVIILRNSSDLDKNLITAKIKSINDEINNVEKGGMPFASVSAGVAFSDDGFSEELFRHADEALYFVKNNWKQDIQFYDNLDKKETLKMNNTTFRSFYSENVYILDKDTSLTISKEQPVIDDLLRRNHAVGIMAVKNEPGFPIHYLSEFVAGNLGFNYESLIRSSAGNLINLVHPDERNFLISSLNHDTGEIQVRMICNSEEYYWMNLIYSKLHLKNNTNMIMISLRIINNDVLGRLCEQDYQAIGVIDCINREISIEKTGKTPSHILSAANRRYNFDSLLATTVATSIRPFEQELALKTNSIEYVQKKLKQNEIYENILSHKIVDNSIRIYRHKYRYLDKERGLILYSQEDVTDWAEIDEVTGVQNIRGFDSCVTSLLENSKSIDKYSIILFDIKGFKMINSMLGQEKGNTCLKHVSYNLKDSKLKPIYISRIFADRFVCLVETENINQSTLLKLCSQTISFNKNILNVNLYCGIYNINKNDNIHDISSMIDKAKLATNYISNIGLRPFCFFDNYMNEEYQENIEISNLLMTAIEDEEFDVFFQPIYDTKTRKIASAEALVRWNSKSKGFLSPTKFIPILERNGNISKLDLFVEKSVIKFLTERIASDKKILPISMNLSRHDFLDKETMDSIFTVINQFKLKDNFINFEITESAFYEIGEKGLDTLESLRAKGSKILLDDFGTGFSSLSSMSNQNFDIIKLDKCFVKEIGSNKKTETIISITIELAHSLGSSVVAEGVETKEQYEFLLNKKCDYVQGYLFSKPVCKEEFNKLLDSNESKEI